MINGEWEDEPPQAYPADGRRIGTAGWAVPRAVADAFPAAGTGLQRYAARFAAAEINSTFYKPHRAATFARWAETTPPDFAFALKLPKAVSHERRLEDCEAALDGFFASAAPLGGKFRAVLVQLPPSLVFQPTVAGRFFDAVRARWSGQLACEPRHPSWFGAEADALLLAGQVARVAADPVRAPGGQDPGGWRGFTYRRLHGAPRVYWSSYDEGWLTTLAQAVRADPPGSWCVFDNTASGAAAANALALLGLLKGR